MHHSLHSQYVVVDVVVFNSKDTNIRNNNKNDGQNSCFTVN